MRCSRHERAVWLLLASLAGWSACGGSNRKEPKMPPSPSPEIVAEVERLTADAARDLAGMVPSDTAHALVTEILASSLPDAVDHPNPRRLIQMVHDEMAARLVGVQAADRPALLRRMLVESVMYEMRIKTLELAVARYLRDHPSAPEKARAWINPSIQRTMALPMPDFLAEIDRRRAVLESWKEQAQREYPDLWEQHRIDWLDSGWDLSAARAGRFTAAHGSLVGFLHDAGERPDVMDIH